MEQYHVEIVTGTHNRLSYLRGMMTSARVQLGHLRYRFIIADAGSTDGTLEWLREQRDVYLVEHGKRIGAIRAFDDVLRRTTARYTVIANDDIEFLPGSIQRAFAYLEDTPACGAVAFAHNLQMDPRELREVWSGFNVALMRAHDAAGLPTRVPYAQVAMVRTWLGHQCDWWGSADPIMGEGHTYGADNYLSARIWESGYTVDTVPCVGNKDYAPEDDLRQHNRAINVSTPSAYHRRFPDGPLIAPRVSADTRGDLRILYLPVYEPDMPHQKQTKRSWREALQRIGVVYEWDYINDPQDIVCLVQTFQPHLMLAQIHEAKYLPGFMLAAARKAKPDMFVANWNGDQWPSGLTTPAILDVLKQVDLQLVVNADVLPEYAKLGIKADYLQYAAEWIDDAAVPQGTPHDVLFLGNAYSPARRTLGQWLKNLPYNVGLYGGAWGSLASGWNLYDYTAGASLYRACKIAIGDDQFGSSGFVSNRLFESLHHGAFMLHQRVPDLDKWTGITDGVHYVAWDNLEDLRAKIDHYMTHEDERKRIAACGQAFVRTYHNFDVRCQELLRLIEKHHGRN